jgi:hypothetical protein
VKACRRYADVVAVLGEVVLTTFQVLASNLGPRGTLKM